MKRLLYLCNNDGSDPRINKEIRTLSTRFQIDYVGMQSVPGHSFVDSFVVRKYLIHAQRKSIWGLCQYIYLVAKLLYNKTYHTIHIVNEPLLIVCYPILLLARRPIVLDLFDSLFLRMSRGNEQCYWLKYLLYRPVDCILVTDDARKQLLPKTFFVKAKVVPNYPHYFETFASRKELDEALTLFYYGWFGAHRGTDLLMAMLQEKHVPIRVIMAGWFGDEKSKQLLQDEQVSYLGILSQEEAITVAREQADYILCVYRPVNQNNVFASPNKVYDAIQAEVPVIMNAEVNMSKQIEEWGIGVVLPSYLPNNLAVWIDHLMQKRGTFTFSGNLKQRCTWEAVAHQLLEAHQV